MSASDHTLTVGELRQALRGLPADMPVVLDDGQSEYANGLGLPDPGDGTTRGVISDEGDEEECFYLVFSDEGVGEWADTIR